MPLVASASVNVSKVNLAKNGQASPPTGEKAGLFSSKFLQQLRWIACLLSVGLFALYVHASLHWPVLWDGATMHYIVFLLRHGFQPYSDITDMNLPGCYLMEGWAMNIFGWGDLSWRIYEYFLMLVLAASGMVIGGRRRWMAGVYCALYFTLMHGAEGPAMAVERDEVMTVLLVIATAFFFMALRKRKAWLLFPFGLLCGLAESMKPGAALVAVVLTALALVVVRRRGLSVWPSLLLVLSGHLVVLAMMLGFLFKHHAFAGLLFIVRDVLPSYAKEKNFGHLYLLRHLTPVPLIPITAVALVAAYVRRERWHWERSALLLVVATSALTYWLQAKGYLYHRYTYTAFLLLWVGWELSGSEVLRRRMPALLEISGLLLLFLVAVPFYVHRIEVYPTIVPQPQTIGYSLERDLTSLGGDRLQNQVQCLDLVNGCLTALYHLRLVQNTGTTGDLLLFSPEGGAAVDFYRHWFLTQELAHPPDVVVLGNEWYFEYKARGNKLDTWPVYAAFLHDNYLPVGSRVFGPMEHAPAYEIYLRKGSTVLAEEQKHPL